MKTIAFFNNKGGVGKTVLVYHLSQMIAQMGNRVIVADLDPQANLSAMFMDDDELSRVWEENDPTIYTALLPLIQGTGDLEPFAKQQEENIFLITGDIRLSSYEDSLSSEWAKCLEGDMSSMRSFRVETAFFRIIQDATDKHKADYAFIDVGPNLGAINRAALLACDYIITPLSPDLFSWQGLNNMGPTLERWRKGWKQRIDAFNDMPGKEDLKLPSGNIKPLGYTPMRFTEHATKPVKSYQRWMDKMPLAFAKLTDSKINEMDTVIFDQDPNCLGVLKDYRSIMSMAQEKHKPMFNLTSADGVIGGHVNSVRKCHEDFRQLADKIMDKISLE